MSAIKSCRGFTLIEIAIVLIVVTILIGYSVALLPVQQELRQYREAKTQMEGLIEDLIAFAQVNGRLPCPDTSGGSGAIDGLADLHANPDFGCESFFGFLPARTLALSGDFDTLGRLLDPWGQPYLYSVSNINAGGNTEIDLVVANGIRDEGLNNVVPDLAICDGSTVSGQDITCADVTGNPVLDSVAAVIVSTGKDLGNVASNVQVENTDFMHADFENGDLEDKVFIFSSRNDATGTEYDDLVYWLSTNRLFSKMIEADRLP